MNQYYVYRVRGTVDAVDPSTNQEAAGVKLWDSVSAEIPAPSAIEAERAFILRCWRAGYCVLVESVVMLREASNEW